MSVDINKIANIISDIQSAQSELEGSDKEIKVLETDLDNARERSDELRVDIQTLRDELDSYLDEVIPDAPSKSYSGAEYPY